jgi:ubiquinone/menaquinone biosynthesis C-methylase UbiE
VAALLQPDKTQILCLDVGTGTGFIPSVFGEALLYKGYCLYQVLSDLSLEMLIQARRKLTTLGVKGFVVTDAERVALEDDSFDIITLNSVLHHLPSPERFMEESHRLLKPGGLLVIAHEPRAGFYASWLFNLVRLVAKVLSILEKSRTDTTRRESGDQEFWPQVMSRLAQHGVKGLTPTQVQVLVDIHSPTASGIPDRTRGIRVESLIDPTCWEVVDWGTYAHLGKLSAKGVHIGWIRFMDWILRILFPHSGASFWVIARKAMSL